MKDVPIYRKVLDNNLARRAVAIERINRVVIDENNKLRTEVLHLQQKVFQLNEELEHDLSIDDFMGHFVGESVTTEVRFFGNEKTPGNEKTALTNNKKNKCCCIL